MNLAFNIPVDDAEIRRRILEQTNNAVDRHLYKMFNDGRCGEVGQAHVALTSHIDDLLVSQKSIELIQRVIDNNWEALLTTSTLKALRHKANRLAFSAAKEKFPKEYRHVD